MRVNLRRRAAFVAALVIPAIAGLALSASPAFAALPRYGRLVLGAHNTVTTVAVVIIAVGTAAVLGLVVITTRRGSHSQHATITAVPGASAPPAEETGEGRRAA